MDRSLKGKNPVPGPTLRHLFTVPGWWTLPRCQGLSIEYYRGSHVGVILVPERWNSSKHSWMKMVPTLVTRDSRRFLQDTPWWRSLRRSSWKRRKEPQDRHSVSPLCPEGKRIARKQRRDTAIFFPFKDPEFISFLGFNVMPRRIPDFPDSFHSWNFLSSIGSGITFLSFSLFSIPSPMREKR